MSQKDDDLTVSKIYGVLKSPSFLQKLYWDTLSVVKREETYKEVRSLAERLIDQKMETLENLGDSESDNVRRKTTVAEICSMCYAIDTVYSKILFIKLVKAVKSLIPILVEELRNEGKIPDDVWLSISESHKSSDDANTVVLDTQKSDTLNEPSTSSGIRKRKVISTNGEASGINCKNITSNDVPVKKRGRPRKKLGGRIQAFPEKNVLEPATSTPKKGLIEKMEVTLPSVSKNIETNHVGLVKDSVKINGEKQLNSKGSMEIDKQESDAESEISVGHVSIISVSSVHTSDLSSFDDEISLSSDEEGEKKKLSFKHLQKKFSHNEKLPSATSEKISNVEQIKSPSQVSSVEGVGSSAESVTSQPSEVTGTSKRVRKPNSKYSSDSIICAPVRIKERRKSNEFSRINTEKSPKQLSPKIKKIKTDNESTETSSVTQKLDNPLNNINSSVNTTPQQNDSLHKSQTTLPSLTSRRTAPVTLFSTGT